MNISTFAFIEDLRGKILLGQDITREQKWGMPGGTLEPYELVHEAVARETLEETGLIIETISLLGIFTHRKSEGIVLLFKAHIIGGELIRQTSETQDCRYFSVAEIEKMQSVIKPAQLSMIKQIQQNKAAENTLPIFNFFV